MNVAATISELNRFRADLSGAFELVARTAEARNVTVKDMLGKMAYKSRNRRDKKTSYTDDDRRAVYERDGGVCFHCHQEIELADMDVDHIIPFSRGGKTNLINGVCSCYSCNRSRQAKLYFVPSK